MIYVESSSVVKRFIETLTICFIHRILTTAEFDCRVGFHYFPIENDVPFDAYHHHSSRRYRYAVNPYGVVGNFFALLRNGGLVSDHYRTSEAPAYWRSLSPEVADGANPGKEASPTGGAEVGGGCAVGAGGSGFSHLAFLLC